MTTTQSRPTATRRCPIDARVADLLGADDPGGEARPARVVLGLRDRRRRTASTPTGWPRSPATGIGQITRLAGSTNLRPAEVAETANAIQRHLVEGTRLGIPAIIHEECLHGLIAWDAPCFQQSIGAAASFDPDVVDGDGGDDPPADAADRRPARARPRPRHRARPALGPDRGDLRRGPVPRGRARLRLRPRRSRAGPRDGVLATGKHLVGHGLAEGGLQPGPGPRRARASCGTSSSSRSRPPSATPASPASCPPTATSTACLPCLAELLTDDPARRVGLRRHRRLGLHRRRDARHARTGSRRTSARRRAGARGRRRRGAAADRRYGEPLAAGARRRPRRRGPAGRGRRPGPADEVPARALRAPVRGPPAEAALERARRRRRRGRPRRSPSARSSCSRTTASCRSRPDLRRIAVIGPDRRQRPRPARRLQPPRPHGDAAGDARQASTRSASSATARSSRRATSCPADGRSSTRCAPRCRGRGRPCPGHGHLDRDRRGARGGRRAARDADVAIVVLGERSGLTDDSTTGEFRDRREPRVHRPPAGAARGRGRDRHAGRARRRERPPAGPALGGRALRRDPARVGARRRRAGRDRRRAHRRREPGRQAAGRRCRARRPGAAHLPPPPDRRPLAPEGRLRRRPGRRRSGRSGSAARTRPSRSTDLRLDRTRPRPTGGEVDDPRRRRRTPGDRPGDEVVQLYVRDEEATVARPVRELRGFRRVAPRARRAPDGRLPLSTEQLAYVGADYRRVVEPGRVSVQVGPSSADLPLTAELELRGPVVELAERQHYLTQSTIE